jgi:hypothetical protein
MMASVDNAISRERESEPDGVRSMRPEIAMRQAINIGLCPSIPGLANSYRNELLAWRNIITRTTRHEIRVLNFIGVR